MDMLFAVLFVSLVVLSVAEFRIRPSVRNPMFNQGWESMKVAAHAKTQVASSYLIIARNKDSSTCSDLPDFKYGTGFNICMTGSDASGKNIGSKFNAFKSVDEHFIIYDVLNYASFDCSGSVNVVPVTIPLGCIKSEDDYGYTYSYSNSSTPWKYMGPGFVTEYFDSKQSCSGNNVGGIFNWIGLNTCLLTESELGSPQSMKFNSCDGAKFSLTQYSDIDCTSFAMSMTSVLGVCSANSDNIDELRYDTFETQMCVKK